MSSLVTFDRVPVVTAPERAFAKSKRVLRHADFQRVYKLGRRQFTGNMTVFFLRRAAPEPATDHGASLRVGFTVGKVLGGSVERNRLKRRMREAVRTSWPEVEAPVDVVFHPRKSVIEMPFAEVAREVARGLQLAVQRAREAQEKKPANAGGREMKAVIQAALLGYKRWISPMLPHACRFVPTCSEYALEAVERHGVLRGSWLALMRLLRCHPLARAGFDPVPAGTKSSIDVAIAVESAPLGAAPESMSRLY